MKLHWKARSG
ncbi:hypothetical protein D031_3999A, partial [Vibrio parahaemolyticus VP-48]